MEKKLIRIVKRNNQKGYSLLEYCVGAAALLGLVYAGMTTLGGSLQEFLGNLGDWITERGEQMETDGDGSSGSGSNP
jgi:hypothetical protein